MTADATRLMFYKSMRRWYREGLLCIGDSAHAMSRVGGVGISLARFSTAARDPRTSHSVRRFLCTSISLSASSMQPSKCLRPCLRGCWKNFSTAAPNHGTNGRNRFPSRACARLENIAGARSLRY